MRWNEFRQSVREGLRALKDWYAAFGTAVAILALTNFVFSLFRVDLALSVQALLSTYKAIVHGTFDWLTYVFGFRLPWWAKDIAFLYILVGGGVARSERESPLFQEMPSNWKRAWSNLFGSEGIGNSAYQRWTDFLLFVPRPIRIFDRLFLWPRRLRTWFRRPRVHWDDYHGTNDYWFYPVGTKTSKPFVYDRRVSFAVHLAAVLFGFFAVVVVNAFLTVPK
jgi:hypothetical protein